MFVIGTAGHIDHGKSALITRLTGTDPDRLPEEKERGMTIDIGFAYYDTTDNQRIGIIDVPGHERFVKNMIAGAGGIDAVILVIAADDGWMPQSQEHLQIIKLLNIKYGLIALTKIDLAESSWIDLVEEDIKDKLKGSFLENAPVVRLSSVTGDGFDSLKKEINVLAEKVSARDDIQKPRLFVDRSFVLTGMGGVVAGTLRGGSLSMGQSVEVFPSKTSGKVRSLQSHGSQIDKTFPGQRTSISLTGIDKEYLNRGSVISTPEIISDYPDEPVLALSVSVIPESPIRLESRRKLLMILGTTETDGEVRLFDDVPISPGNKGIIFFKPFQPVLSFIGDRLIFRLPTPQITIGGGEVIDILDRFPRKKERAKYDYLKNRENLSVDKLINTELTKSTFVRPDRAFIWSNYPQSDFDSKFEELKSKNIAENYNGRFYNIDTITPTIDEITGFIRKKLETCPHVDGLAPDIIAAGVNKTVHTLEPLMGLMCDKGFLIKKKNKYDLPGRTVSVSGDVKRAAEQIETELKKSKFIPPEIKEMIGNDKTKKEAFEYLQITEKAVKAGLSLAFHINNWNEILSIISEILNSRNELTVGDLRARLGSSRKYIIPILEETDRRRITTRRGDVRVKGANFEEK